MTTRPDDSQSLLDGFTTRFERIGRAAGRRISSPTWLARASAIGLCVSSLAFVALFISGLAAEPTEELALVVEPLPLRLALWIPAFIGVFAVGTFVGAVVAWYNSYWSLVGRIHQTILAILGVLFVWQLSVFGFLPRDDADSC